MIADLALALTLAQPIPPPAAVVTYVPGVAWEAPGAAVAALVPGNPADLGPVTDLRSLPSLSAAADAARVQANGARVVLVSPPRPGHLGGVAVLGATGLLTGSTRRDGLVTYDDVAALVRGGIPTITSGDAGDVAELARREHLHRPYHGIFMTGLIALPMLLYIWLGFGRRRAGFRSRQVARALATYPAAGFLASVVPWWRYSLAGAVAVAAVAGSMAVLLGLGAVVGRFLGGRTEAGIAAVVAVLFAVDLTVGGGYLQETGIPSYSAIAGGRFYGLGNVGFAILATAAAVALGAAARRYGSLAWLWLVPVLVVVAVPSYGADVGGAITLTAALVAALARRPLAAVAGTAGGFVVAAVVAVLDYQRPVADRSHLGRFVGQVVDGTWTGTITRKASAAAASVASFYPLLVVGSAAMAWSLLGRFRDPTLVRVLAVLWVLGSVVNDTGLIVAAAGMAVAVPLLVSYCDRP